MSDCDVARMDEHMDNQWEPDHMHEKMAATIKKLQADNDRLKRMSCSTCRHDCKSEGHDEAGWTVFCGDWTASEEKGDGKL